VVVYQLCGHSPTAFDERFPDHLRDLVHFILFLGDLFFQLAVTRVEVFEFL
jgi:hypothetical protein